MRGEDIESRRHSEGRTVRWEDIGKTLRGKDVEKGRHEKKRHN